jgi:flavin-dependent dehydrogenase
VLDATSGYDITIAGAGPAGSVLALLAARARYRVLLVEKSYFERPRFGETAPPELRQALTRVGLERLAQAPFCREAPEVLSVWGSDEPRSRHHIFSPYGSALHLDRRAFDEALASAARHAGADLRLGCAARFAAQPRGGYIVQLSTGERIRTNAAILATGRAGGGLGLPYARQYLDNNVAVAARLSLPAGHLDTRTVIEAVPGGWFYLAALPGNEVVAVFITLATLVPSERRARLRWWLEALAKTSVVRNALNGCRLPQTLSVANARASFALWGAGDSWLAIGDARIAPDPLSGQGIIWAIDDAVSAMELLTRMHWRDLAQEMRARTLRDVEAYLLERSRVYLSEQRFTGDAYWSAVSSTINQKWRESGRYQRQSRNQQQEKDQLAKTGFIQMSIEL